MESDFINASVDILSAWVRERERRYDVDERGREHMGFYWASTHWSSGEGGGQ